MISRAGNSTVPRLGLPFRSGTVGGGDAWRRWRGV